MKASKFSASRMRAVAVPRHFALDVAPASMDRVFLTAEWRYLAILNYRVRPELLEPLVPRGTQLDLWQGAAYVSVVGFAFNNTRVFGVPVPFHSTFDEVNLRFYVRREVNGVVRRGVTFIRELVPKRAVAFAARLFYNEPYRTVPMRHSYGLMGPLWRPLSVEYSWQAKGTWSRVHVAPTGTARLAAPGSEEEFIIEHQWGYTRSRLGGTIEYQVTHPAWTAWRASNARLEGNLAAVYGNAFAKALAGAPHSALLVDGSAVTVHQPTRLKITSS